MTTDLSVLESAVLNPLWFIPTFMEIEDKDRVRRPFVLNWVQQDIIRRLMDSPDGPGIKRLNVLKASQVGVTSGLQAYFLHNTIVVPGTTSVTVAHEEFITQRLLHKANVFYKSIPDQFKPTIHHDSTYEKSFPDINSVMYIGSARAYVFGRSETIHNLLADEYAFWPDPERIMIPSQHRVPINGLIAKVSTPNGEDNQFCHDWRMAKQGAEVGAAIYTNLMYPWWTCPEYQLPRGSPYALARDLGVLDFTMDEERLFVGFREHGIPEEEFEDRIRWRRRKVEEMEQLRATGESAKFFWQEFIEDDESCFLSVGDMVYDSLTLKRLSEGCYRSTTSIQGFQVWYPPEEHREYVVVVDPSQAKISKTAITVWRWDPQDGDGLPDQQVECARFAGLVGPEVTKSMAKHIAELYNHAMIVVEANSHGLAVVVLLKDYPRLYWRHDIVSGKTSRQIGWLTTPRTKPYMVQSLQRALPGLVTHDIELVIQLRAMRWVGDRAVSVGEDDIHDTAAIAAATYKKAQAGRGYVGSAGWSKW